jgi:hypothetical protein
LTPGPAQSPSGVRPPERLSCIGPQERAICRGLPVRVSLCLGFAKGANPQQIELCDVDDFFGARLEDGRVDGCAVVVPGVAHGIERDRMTALLRGCIVGLGDGGHILDAARTQTDAMVLIVAGGVRNQD